MSTETAKEAAMRIYYSMHGRKRCHRYYIVKGPTMFTFHNSYDRCISQYGIERFVGTYDRHSPVENIQEDIEFFIGENEK